MLYEAYDASDFGRSIKRLRRERTMTQGALAEWLGVSRQTVVSLEQGGPVALTVAMRAIAVLGSKAVLAPKRATLAVLETP